MKALIFAALLTLFLVGQSAAMSVGEWRTLSEHDRQLYLFAFIEGAHDFHSKYPHFRDEQTELVRYRMMFFCLDKHPLSPSKMSEIVIKFIEKEEELKRTLMGKIVAQALLEFFLEEKRCNDESQ